MGVEVEVGMLCMDGELVKLRFEKDLTCREKVQGRHKIQDRVL